jgi:hypothetical protein
VVSGVGDHRIAASPTKPRRFFRPVVVVVAVLIAARDLAGEQPADLEGRADAPRQAVGRAHIAAGIDLLVEARVSISPWTKGLKPGVSS